MWRGLPVDVLELALDFDGRLFHRRGEAYRLDPEDPRYAMVDRVPRPIVAYYGLRKWYNVYDVRFRNRAFELTKTCVDLDPPSASEHITCFSKSAPHPDCKYGVGRVVDWVATRTHVHR